MLFEQCLDTVPALRGLAGRPRQKPKKLHADKGDYRRCRAYLKARGILSRIARRGVPNSQRLGKHRWGVERTHAWYAGCGKLRIRFERRLAIHQALLTLAAAIICPVRGSVVLARLTLDPMNLQRIYDTQTLDALRYAHEINQGFPMHYIIQDVIFISLVAIGFFALFQGGHILMNRLAKHQKWKSIHKSPSPASDPKKQPW